MSNTFHPGVTRHTADLLADQCIGIVMSGESVRPANWDSMANQISDLVASALNAHACRAAGIAGNDPSSIYRSVWYKSDGWGHGGSAIMWRERAEQLEAELAVKNSLIDRAKPHLEDYLETVGYIAHGSARTADQLSKLLTDIEHL